MNSKKRSSLWGTVICIVTILLFSVMLFYGIKLKQLNNTLTSNVEKQLKVINEVEKVNTELKETILQLTEEKKSIQKDKKNLEEENQSLKQQIEESKSAQSNQVTTQSTNRDFKSYMHYEAITDKASKQWALQENALTDENGIRCIDNIPLVAVGTGWGLSIGDIALVICDNGNSFEVIIGDIKNDIHTQADNKTTIANNCRCEFIVDTGQLNIYVKQLGNVAGLSQYQGYVINIASVEK